MLRDYQQQAIDDLWNWFGEGNEGNPVVVLPTGSGKSHVIAEFCKQIVEEGQGRVLILSHVKEILEQDISKIVQHWPTAPLGVYAAGLGLAQSGRDITVASVQTVYDRSLELGAVDFVIIDECHRVSNKDKGMYRELIGELQKAAPHIKVVGFTATPWRLGQGKLTDGKDALFTDLLESVSIRHLVDKGYLAPLRNKFTSNELDVSGVAKRGGEFIEKELQAKVNTTNQNEKVVEEIVARGEGRKSWLIFSTGVDHAKALQRLLEAKGIPTGCILGSTPKKERERLLGDFRKGKLKAITNANVLTTGFDAPGIDLIAMVRPTMSPSLYVQMAGRGMRVAPGKDDCIVLDFAGNVTRHGPITAVVPPTPAGPGRIVPTKRCPDCKEVVPASTRTCPECGHEWEFKPPTPRELALHQAIDIMGERKVRGMEVTAWDCVVYKGKTSGKYLLKVSYYGAKGWGSRPVVEYLTIAHTGFVQMKAVKRLSEILKAAGTKVTVDHLNGRSLETISKFLSKLPPPSFIIIGKEGKYDRVVYNEWTQKEGSNNV